MMTDATIVGPGGEVCMTRSGVLEPGFRAALDLLRLEKKVAESEAEILATKTVAERAEAYTVGQRIRGASFAIALLEEQGERLGLKL